MALIINTQLQTRDGGTVETGAYVKFTPHFNMIESGVINFDLSIYRSEQALIDSKEPLRITNFSNGQTINILEAEVSTINNQVLHEKLKDKLEDILGEDTVTIA